MDGVSNSLRNWSILNTNEFWFAEHFSSQLSKINPIPAWDKDNNTTPYFAPFILESCELFQQCSISPVCCLMQEHRFAYLKNNPFLASHTPVLLSVIKTRIFVRFGRKRVNRIEALEVNTTQAGIYKCRYVEDSCCRNIDHIIISRLRNHRKSTFNIIHYQLSAIIIILSFSVSKQSIRNSLCFTFTAGKVNICRFYLINVWFIVHIIIVW